MGEEEGRNEGGKNILSISELCFIEDHKMKSFNIQQYSGDIQDDWNAKVFIECPVMLFIKKEHENTVNKQIQQI